jgi:hypothetical protein
MRRLNDLAPLLGLRGRRRQHPAESSSQEFAEHIIGALRFRIRGGTRSVAASLQSTA